MFIKTASHSLVELKGIVRINKSPDDVFSIVLANKFGFSVLGEYSSKQSAENVITLIAVAIERDTKVFVMPKIREVSASAVRDVIRTYNSSIPL